METIRITNVRVYGSKESIIASGYPMRTDLPDSIERLNDILHEDDTKRANGLYSTPVGSGHDCFSKGVIVQFDLTAPEYFWRQLDRYHFIDYVSSQSKMHCLTKFDVDKMMNDQVDPRIVEILKEKIESEKPFREILSNVPLGFMMTARMTTNMLQLKNIYMQRENHKLPEWKEFLAFIEQLSMESDTRETN